MCLKLKNPLLNFPFRDRERDSEVKYRFIHSNWSVIYFLRMARLILPSIFPSWFSWYMSIWYSPFAILFNPLRWSAAIWYFCSCRELEWWLGQLWEARILFFQPFTIGFRSQLMSLPGVFSKYFDSCSVIGFSAASKYKFDVGWKMFAFNSQSKQVGLVGLNFNLIPKLAFSVYRSQIFNMTWNYVVVRRKKAGDIQYGERCLCGRTVQEPWACISWD